MRRSSDDAVPPEAVVPSPLRLQQLWVGSVLLVVAAALVYSWDGSPGDGALSSAAAPSPSAGHGRAVAAAGTGGATAGVEAATSVPMANPFSTFQLRDAAAAPASPAQVPPPVPFVYVGKRIEGGRTVVVLSHQGRHVAVHGPGMLDANHEVEVINERQLVLLYLPLMTRQVLSLMAAPAVAAAAPVAPPEQTESDSESDN